MKYYEWKSSVSDLIKQFVNFKHLSVIKFEGQERCLQHFDHYFYYNGFEGRAITKEILLPFIYEQDNSVSMICMKERLFAEFAQYLSDRGFHAFVIKPRYTIPRSNYIPHIYTSDERRRFLAAVDSYPAIYNSNRNIIDPVMFRVIIGTGCRLSEILNLRMSDHDREDGALRIMHSKNDRSRIVPLCSSLIYRLETYIDTFHKDSPADAVLFPGRNGGVMDKSTAYIRFRNYLFMADIPHTASGPRIHDFRHTLAVENLRRWAESGKDLSTMLPYLSAFMGHSDFRATQYYLRMTAEVYPKLVEQMEDLLWDIIPEGEFDDESDG